MKKITLLAILLLSFIGCNSGTSITPDIIEDDEGESVLSSFLDDSNWYHYNVETTTRAIEKTFFSGGLVGDTFNIVEVSSNGILAAQVENRVSSTKGFSYIPMSNISDPVGYIENWIVTSSSGSWNWVIGSYIGSDNEIYVLANDTGVDDSIVTVLLKASTKEKIATYDIWGGVNDTNFNKMARDAQGYLWTATFSESDWLGYITRFNPSDGTYSHLKSYAADGNGLGDFLTSRFFPSSAGEVWILGLDYVHFVDSSGAFHELSYNDTPFSQTMSRDNDQWDEGFFIHDGQTYAYSINTSSEIEIYSVSGQDFTVITSYSRTGLYPDQRNKGFSYNGLYYFPDGYAFDPVGETVSASTFPFSGGDWGELNEYPYIYRYANGVLVQTLIKKYMDDVTLRIFSGGSVYTLTAANTSDGLMQNNIKYTYIAENGLLYVVYPARGYSTIDTALKIDTYGFPAYISEITEYNGTLLAGTDIGLYEISSSNPVITDYTDFTYMADNTSDQGNGFMEFIDDHLWVATEGGVSDPLASPMARIDLATGATDYNGFWTLPIGQNSYVVDIEKDPVSGDVYFSYWHDLAEIKHSIVVYRSSSSTWENIEEPDSGNFLQFYSFFATSDDIYLFEYSNASILYKLNGTQWVKVFDNIDWNTNGIPIDGVKIGNYLVLYGGADGFLVVDEDNNRYVQLTALNSPLPSNRINTLSLHNLGNDNYRLWFGTDTGLCFMKTNISKWEYWE